MRDQQSETAREKSSKTGMKGPRPYYAYIIGVIVVILAILYSIMYW